MIGTLRAFLWLRWRIGLNAFKARTRRDTLEQLSRALAALLPLFTVVLVLPSALVMTFLGGRAGLTMAREGSAHLFDGAATVSVRVGLLVVTLGVVMAPFVRMGHGGDRNVTRLLLLPIRRGSLHLAEVLSGFADVWLGLVAAATLALPVGLALGGALLPAALSAIATLGLLAALSLLGASLAFGMGLVFRRRRRAEWFTLVGMTIFVVAMVSIGLLDGRFDGSRHAEPAAPQVPLDPAEQKELERARSALRRPINERLDAALPVAVRALPSELFVSAVALGVEGRAGAASVPLAALLLWVGLLYGASRKIYFRLLETPESGISQRGGKRAPQRLQRIPGLTPAASAVALAHLRLALRTVRGKLAVFLNFLVLSLMWGVALGPKLDLALPVDSGLGWGMLLALAGFAFTMLALQPLLFNLYAIDGTGLTLEFLAPITPRELVVGKISAAALLAALSTALCVLAAFLLEPGGDPLLWLAALATAGSAFALIAPIAALLSATFPKTADLSRLGKHGNPHGLAALIATVITPLALCPGLLLATVGLLLLESRVIALLLVLAWTALVVPVSRLLLRLAVGALDRRRETLVLVANGR